MAKILVTGATGFIGNYVVNELLKANHEVIATSVKAEKAATMPWYHNVTYIKFDLAAFDDTVDYYRLLGSADRAIHLSWEGLPNYNASFHQSVNLPRHFSFLQNLIKNGLKHLTVTGTCLEYGMQEGKLTEDLPPQPANPYALAKDSLRNSLQQLQDLYDFGFSWIRLFYMYGKGQNEQSLFSQLNKAIIAKATEFNMSGGEQIRDFMPVEEVAACIVKIALQDRITGIINCCSGTPVKVKDLVEKYLQEQHVSLRLNLGYYPYSNYEPMEFWGDNTKMKSIFKS
jgi:nucleoside-diphosphate-sugar epimerase